MNETQKTAAIFGLANKRSIAYAIAQKLSEAGATLAICYCSLLDQCWRLTSLADSAIPVPVARCGEAAGIGA